MIELEAAARALIAIRNPPVMNKTCLICLGYLGARHMPPFGHRDDCKWERLRRACEAGIETTDAPGYSTTATIPRPAAASHRVADDEG